MALEIVRVPAFTDNYLWLVHDPDSGETAVVDPGDATAVLASADQRGWRINQIWNTHWHPDHTGGNLAVRAAHGAVVSGPSAESDKIPGFEIGLSEGDQVALGAHRGDVREVPGHTLGHIAFLFDGLAFVGDTLFAMGCGRLFEGTPAQMFASLAKLAALPPQTAIYCAHEYTLSNARFAAHSQPQNSAISARLAEVETARAEGRPTVPTTIAKELATNPFLLAGSVDEFARRRAAKDSFR